MTRQDSQNGPEYNGVSNGTDRPDAGKWQPAAPDPATTAQIPAPGAYPPSGLPPAPPAASTGDAYGKASVPLNTARPAVPAPAPPPQPAAAPEPDAEPAAPDFFSNPKMASIVLAAVVLLAVVVVGVVEKPGPIAGWFGDSASPAGVTTTPDPKPTPVLAAAAAQGTAPNPTAVKAVLDPLIRSAALGGKVHVSVMDVASQQVLYAQNADIPTTPASTAKLLTAVTVLAARGPAYRLTTRVVAGAKPGEVVLVGGGDPTLAVNAKAEFPGAARLDQLAAQVKKAMGATPITRVTVDTSLFTGPETGLGWSPDDVSPDGQVARIQALMTNAGRITPVHHENGGDPRFADPALAAGRAFANFLGVPSEKVAKGRAPDAGTELGKVDSPPLVQILDWMLQESDNTLAETMARQVAIAAHKEASFDGASEAMIAKLRELGLPGDEADLYDGSGLSRHDGLSPTLLVQALALAAGGTRPELSAMFDGLPVAGWSGTLRTRFVTPSPNRAAQGVVRAKTGTLSGVNTLAGVLVTKDGRVLSFAIMATGTSNAASAKTALDRVAAKLVACGCS
ncbi:D-alanyl-D-alanine carboxypeptidase [Actinoplanes sp. SE50]|nr:D-alanyl-D-alanine carboxypeptidase / D-alanyl-D-alanine-endopeptidase (penicillin-binding protein 4) [Actinoplanes sp. SE50/110]ATO87378.1 D-alanyl-D-alanine carboxypeptidase [Actinoplanes sp. SE50]SLM04796.1 D-alanyl-D-alanine carboxypeptidase/D-alanyl-D-alanine-endopeptidase [Actinoplanes sp. SE50/110]